MESEPSLEGVPQENHVNWGSNGSFDYSDGEFENMPEENLVNKTKYLNPPRKKPEVNVDQENTVGIPFICQG